MSDLVFRAISGNVIGIVEGPDTLDPEKPLKDQYIVKIGVLDRSGPLPRKDAQKVISKLLAFVQEL
jgi:hypothetical protein